MKEGKEKCKPRADAERNRNQLMDAAKFAISEIGPGVSLEEIARKAGVGIGTLYRHFPTRIAMVNIVYRQDVHQLTASASQLLERLAPIEALRGWMRLFVQSIAVRQIIPLALDERRNKSGALATTEEQVTTAMALLVERAILADEIKPAVDPIDLVYALVVFCNINLDMSGEKRVMRLIDMLIAGIALNKLYPIKT